MNLEELDLQGTKITDSALAPLTYMSKLRSLNLVRCPQITDDALGLLKFLPTLTRLRLEDTNITDEGVASIASMKNLRRLSLGRLITDVGVERLSRLRGLTELDLSYSQVSDNGKVG